MRVIFVGSDPGPAWPKWEDCGYIETTTIVLNGDDATPLMNAMQTKPPHIIVSDESALPKVEEWVGVVDYPLSIIVHGAGYDRDIRTNVQSAGKIVYCASVTPVSVVETFTRLKANSRICVALDDDGQTKWAFEQPAFRGMEWFVPLNTKGLLDLHNDCRRAQLVKLFEHADDLLVDMRLTNKPGPHGAALDDAVGLMTLALHVGTSRVRPLSGFDAVPSTDLYTLRVALLSGLFGAQRVAAPRDKKDWADHVATCEKTSGSPAQTWGFSSAASSPTRPSCTLSLRLDDDAARLATFAWVEPELMWHLVGYTSGAACDFEERPPGRSPREVVTGRWGALLRSRAPTGVREQVGRWLETAGDPRMLGPDRHEHFLVARAGLLTGRTHSALSVRDANEAIRAIESGAARGTWEGMRDALGSVPQFRGALHQAFCGLETFRVHTQYPRKKTVGPEVFSNVCAGLKQRHRDSASIPIAEGSLALVLHGAASQFVDWSLATEPAKEVATLFVAAAVGLWRCDTTPGHAFLPDLAREGAIRAWSQLSTQRYDAFEIYRCRADDKDGGLAEWDGMPSDSFQKKPWTDPAPGTEAAGVEAAARAMIHVVLRLIG